MTRQPIGKPSPSPGDATLKEYFPFAAAIFVGAVLSICLFLLFLRHNTESLESDFHRWAEMKTASLVYTTEDVEKFLSMTQAFYAASQHVDMQEFRRFSGQFVERKGVAAIAQIYPGEKDGVWKTGYFLSAHSNIPQNAFDARILSRKEVRETLDLSKKTRQTTTSAAFPLEWSGSTENRSAITLATPVFEDVSDPHTSMETRHPTGWIVVVVLLDPFVRDATRWDPAKAPATLRAYIEERDAPSSVQTGEPLVILNGAHAENTNSRRSGAFFYSVGVPFGSRQLRIFIEPTPDYLAAAVNWSTWTVLSLGLLLTGMLGTVLYQQASRHIETRAQISLKNKALLESESLHRTVLENTVDGIITIDREGIVMTYNPACTILFGYTPEEVIGRNINMLMPDPDKSRHDGYIGHYLKTGEAKIIGVGREVHGQRKNGDVFPMDLSIGEVLQDNTHLFVGIVRDITARKEVEDALHQSNAALDDFVYIVSHDLKEPLRGVRNYSRFLVEDHADKLDADGKDKLATLERLARRMEEQINSLLAYSRANRAEITCETVDPRKIIADIIDSFHVKIGEMNATVVVEKNLPVLFCNAACLREILGNLIGNALKYNDSPAPTITIGCAGMDTRGDHVLFVRDNGIGIREEHQSIIFNMFKRLHTTDRYGGGTGSGLAIVRKLVERHGGKIRVESKPGEGAAFFFTLKEGEKEKFEHAA